MLVGAAIAFPVGMLVADRAEPKVPLRPERGVSIRDVFSPNPRDDPHFLGRQQENVEALEEHCRDRSEMCAEAKAARAWLAELESAR